MKEKLATTLLAIAMFAATFAAVQWMTPADVDGEWATRFNAFVIAFLCIFMLTEVWVSVWASMAVLIGGWAVVAIGSFVMWPYLGQM